MNEDQPESIDQQQVPDAAPVSAEAILASLSPEMFEQFYRRVFHGAQRADRQNSERQSWFPTVAPLFTNDDYLSREAMAVAGDFALIRNLAVGFRTDIEAALKRRPSQS